MIEDHKSWKYKWSFKEFLPKGLLGLGIALVLIFISGRYKGVKVEKFNGDWGPIIFMVGAMSLAFFILWLLDTLRNMNKKSKSSENK